MFQIRPMTYHDASVISHWTYPDEFRIYSFEPSEELMAELLDGSYAACFNESKELVDGSVDIPAFIQPPEHKADHRVITGDGLFVGVDPGHRESGILHCGIGIL